MTILTFGPYRLDTRSLELRRDGRRIRLRPQPCRVLALLAARAGELVTREELKAALWPEGVHVRFDVGLNSCLKQIRSALGESVGSPQMIETLTRRGYRFIGDVRREQNPTSGANRRLAVLPFRPVDRGAGRFTPLTEGLTEEVTVHLSRLKPPHLRIVSRSMLPDDILESPSLKALRELGVDFVLEGRVQTGPSAIRVSVQLIDACELTSLWAQTYDASLEDVLAAQRLVARTISADLRAVIALSGIRAGETGAVNRGAEPAPAQRSAH
jgi:DNA-binding winged helix-turn-helix (wHTH) protein